MNLASLKVYLGPALAAFGGGLAAYLADPHPGASLATIAAGAVAAGVSALVHLYLPVPKKAPEVSQ